MKCPAKTYTNQTQAYRRKSHLSGLLDNDDSKVCALEQAALHRDAAACHGHNVVLGDEAVLAAEGVLLRCVVLHDLVEYVTKSV